MYAISRETYDQGYSFEEYLDRIVNNRQIFMRSAEGDLLAGFCEREQEAAAVLERLRLLPPGKIVAIVEDWCSDAFTTLGFWVRFSREFGWEMKVFQRDSGPDLISHFLKNGKSKSIPVYAFYSADLEPVYWFSGRHPAGEPFKERFLKGRKYDALSTREKVLFRKELTRYYEDGLFAETIIDILTSLAERLENRA